MSTMSDEQVNVWAKGFAKELKIPYDKIVIKKNGGVIFKRESDSVGEGYPGLLIPNWVLRNFHTFAATPQQPPKPLIDEELRHKIHMQMLGKSGNAKDCGDLTVVPLGHAVTIALEIVRAERTALLDRVLEEGSKDAKQGGYERCYSDYWYNSGFNGSNDAWRSLLNRAKEGKL